MSDSSHCGKQVAGLDQTQIHDEAAHGAAELRTFQCDRVRKMSLSEVDPDMLFEFLCKNNGDEIDLRQRVTGVYALSFIHNPGLNGGVGYSRIIRWYFQLLNSHHFGWTLMIV